MRIALAQLRATTDPQANLALVADLTRRAAQAEAAVAVFPEATMCSFARPSAHIRAPTPGNRQHGHNQCAFGFYPVRYFHHASMARHSLTAPYACAAST